MSEIEIICQQIISEAKSCVEYSTKIEDCLQQSNKSDLADFLDDIRIDNVRHLHDLVEKLEDCFFENAPSKSEEDEK